MKNNFKKKWKQFLVISMAFSMILCTNAFATPINLSNSTESVTTDTHNKANGTDYFDDEDTNVWQDGSITEEARVTVSRTSQFEVTIPKEVVLDGSTGTAAYKVKAKGDIAGDQKITVTPDASFTLSEAGGNANVTANVIQPNTEYNYTDLQGDGTEYDGNIAATLTAGEWSGKFSFNIGFKTNEIHIHNADKEIQVQKEWELIESENFSQSGNVWTVIKNEDEYDGTATAKWKLDLNIEQNIIIPYTASNILSGQRKWFEFKIILDNKEIVNFNHSENSDSYLINLDPGIHYIEVFYYWCNAFISTEYDPNIYEDIGTNITLSPVNDIIKGCSEDEHVHTFITEITKEATCTETGLKTYVCQNCSYIHCTKEILATGHNYTSEITKEATFTETGIKINTCTKCNHSYTEIIPIKEKTFNDYSWAEIAAISEAGNATSTFSVGDEKELQISDETYHVQILGFNHDDKSDGSGKAGITVCLKELMTTTNKMNSYTTNIGGWKDSEMRTYLQNDVLTSLPSDLQSVIKTVNKISDNGNKDTTTLNITEDKLFLLSFEEVGFTSANTSYFVPGQGTKYDFFSDNASRTKKYLNKSYDAYWWLRSAYTDYSSIFFRVSLSGSWNNGYADHTNGVVFAFCI